MTSYSNNLEVQGKKIKVEVDKGDDAIHIHNQEQKGVVCHDFWNRAPDDLLIEIFIRHPDCRSAVRTSTVCRLWHSLISRNSQFIRRFKSHHHRHPFLPWTTMFRITDFYEHPVPEPQHFRTICQLYSDEWMFLHGNKFPANYSLDFLPSSSSLPMLIKASCNDLLLVSNGSCCTDDHYICNPITKQFVQLPAIPRLEDPDISERGAIGYAIVPSATHFKVVEVLPPYDHPLPLGPAYRTFPVSVFCSESRKWEIRQFPCPENDTMWISSCSLDIITCNGILYWLGNSIDLDNVVYLDLSKDKCGAINIPSGDKIFSHRIGIVRVSGGAHELRLLKTYPKRTHEDSVHLKVWRLDNNNDGGDSNWCLVHDKKLERPTDLGKVVPFVGPFVHPTNGDLAFLVLGRNVIQYNLIDGTYKKIAELTETVEWTDFTAFPMVLSSGDAADF